MQISFTPEFARRLRQHMRLNSELGHNPHGGGNTYDLEIALGEDLLLTSVGWANCYYQDTKAYTDEWGIGWKPCAYETPFGQGVYTEMQRIRLPMITQSICINLPTPIVQNSISKQRTSLLDTAPNTTS